MKSLYQKILLARTSKQQNAGDRARYAYNLDLKTHSGLNYVGKVFLYIQETVIYFNHLVFLNNSLALLYCFLISPGKSNTIGTTQKTARNYSYPFDLWF